MSAVLRGSRPGGRRAAAEDRPTRWRRSLRGAPRAWRRALGVALSTLKWVALALLAALAAAPVAVSLRWGPTPRAAALLLAAHLDGAPRAAGVGGAAPPLRAGAARGRAGPRPAPAGHGRPLPGHGLHPADHGRAGEDRAGQHRHPGAGHPRRQRAVDQHPGPAHRQPGAALAGRGPGGQPAGDGAPPPRRPGGALRGGGLGAARGGQVLPRRAPRRADPGALRRRRPRAGAVPAPALRPGEGLPGGRVLGQRAGRLAGAAAPRAVPRLRRHRPDGGLPGDGPPGLRARPAPGPRAGRRQEGGGAGAPGAPALLRGGRGLEAGGVPAGRVRRHERRPGHRRRRVRHGAGPAEPGVRPVRQGQLGPGRAGHPGRRLPPAVGGGPAHARRPAWRCRWSS